MVVVVVGCSLVAMPLKTPKGKMSASSEQGAVERSASLVIAGSSLLAAAAAALGVDDRPDRVRVVLAVVVVSLVLFVLRLARPIDIVQFLKELRKSCES